MVFEYLSYRVYGIERLYRRISKFDLVAVMCEQLSTLIALHTGRMNPVQWPLKDLLEDGRSSGPSRAKTNLSYLTKSSN